MCMHDGFGRILQLCKTEVQENIYHIMNIFIAPLKVQNILLLLLPPHE